MPISMLARIARRLARSPDEAAPDIDRVTDDVQACRTALAAERVRGTHVRDRLATRAHAMSDVALDYAARDRDDLAHAVLTRQSQLQRHGIALERDGAASLEREARLDESLAALRRRKAEIDGLVGTPST